MSESNDATWSFDLPRELGNKVYLRVQFKFHQKTDALTVVNESLYCTFVVPKNIFPVKI